MVTAAAAHARPRPAGALSPRNVEEFAHRSSASLVGLGATSDELLASGREVQKCRLRCLSHLGMLGRRPDCAWGPVTFFKKGARAARGCSCELDGCACELDRRACDLEARACKPKSDAMATLSRPCERGKCVGRRRARSHAIETRACKPNTCMCLGCRRTNRLRWYACKPNRGIC